MLSTIFIFRPILPSFLPTSNFQKGNFSHRRGRRSRIRTIPTPVLN
nr:MAG TPA: hypothetical protein [Caudoviricetes sp.]